MASKEKNEVAVADAKTTALALPVDMSQFAGMGTEEADGSSVAIPFITALQGLSPQLETVDGARPGLFIETISNELFKEILVIPCSFQRRFNRWAPRESGGGYKGNYSPVEVEGGSLKGIVMDENNRPTIEGDLLSDTRNHYVLYQDANGAWKPALISLASTQIKRSKRWMSRILGLEMAGPNGPFNPPSFSHVYRIKPIKDKNAKGEWWSYDIDLEGPVSDGALFQKAIAFHKSVAAGEVQVQDPSGIDPEAAGGGDDAKGF